MVSSQKPTALVLNVSAYQSEVFSPRLAHAEGAQRSGGSWSGGSFPQADTITRL
jgi:hypothetical protein